MIERIFRFRVGLLVIALASATWVNIALAEPVPTDVDGLVRGERPDQEEKIETDRHNFTESSKTVGKRTAQLEFGYTYFLADSVDESESTHTTPELALRYGITDAIELKIRWNYAWRTVNPTDGEDESFSSAEDLRLTLKLALWEQNRWIPETALQLRGSVPSGGRDWSTDGAEPGLNIIYAWEIAHGCELSASTGVDSDGAGDVSLFDAELGRDDSFNAWHQSVALGIPLLERNEAYIEWFGIRSAGLEEGFVQSYFNVGIDHLINENLVIDVRVGRGLTRDSEDLFVGIGGGIRF